MYHEYKCEVCGERFNLLMAESSENEHSYILKCSKCRAKYKAPKMTNKKTYAFAIPIAIVCVLGYISLNQHFGLDPFYGKVMIAGVICVFFCNFLYKLY